MTVGRTYSKENKNGNCSGQCVLKAQRIIKRKKLTGGKGSIDG